MAASSPLIGRGADLAALGEAIDRDRATVVLGEAGIGKTALVRAVAAGGERALREGGAFATLRATPYVALRRAVGVGLSGDPATVAARLERAIGPDLLFVDDAQWADEATLAAVCLLVGRIALVTAVRSLDPGAAGAVALLEAAGATVHQVSPLSTDAARELVEARQPDLPARLVDDIIRRAAGNPLLLEEMAESGEATPILARVLTSRLDQLSGPAREVVELLAIAERPLPRDLLPDAAAEAIGVGLAVEAEGGVEIRHQLVGDAIRERLAEPSRGRLHARVAELTSDRAAAARHLAAAGRTEAAAELAVAGLETATDARERAGLLVIAAEASPPEAALPLRLQAARAFDEISEWDAVVRLLDDLPEGASADAGAESHALRAHAAFALGDIATCRRHVEAMDRPEVALGSAAGVRRAIEAATFLVNVEGDVAGAVARLDATAAALSPGQADADDVAALREAILLLAAGQGDVERIGEAADRAFAAGRFRTATDRARVVQYFLNMAVGSEAALAYLIDRHQRYAEAGVASMAHDFLADGVVAAILSGRLREAVTMADGLLEEPASPRPRQKAEIHRARALVLLGQIDEAEHILEVTRPFVSADYFGLGETLFGLAEAALWGGRPDLAVERAAAALAVPAPLPAGRVPGLLTLARARWELGRPVGALLEEIRAASTTPSLAAAPLEAHALEAAVAGDHSAASEGFAAAAAAWARYNAPNALVCRWASGESNRHAASESAIDDLRAALDGADAMGFEPLAARIRRSLRLLGVRVPAKPAAAGGTRPGLTARERELVGLVEHGLTNVEIARRLGLGRPTIARILGSAMAKRGVGSRAELAAAGPD